MNILEYIILAAGFAYAFYEVRLKDAHKASLQEIWTTPGELNSLFKGKDGYYSETKGIIVDSIVAGIGLAFAFIAPYEHVKLAVGLIFAGIGGGIHLMQAKDWKRFKETLAKQKTTLELIRRDPEGFNRLPKRIAGLWVIETFFDFGEPLDLLNGESDPLYVEKRAAANTKIKPRLVALANRPESDWFREDRSELV